LKQQNENRRNVLLPLVLIGVFTVLFYLPQLVSGRTLFSTNLYQFLPWKHLAVPADLEQPVNSMLSDPLVYFYPVYRYVQTCLRNQILPMWNPYLLCGYPLIADGTVGFFYPLKWPLLALNASQVFMFSAMLRVFLAGFFMFLYLSYIGVGRKAALFGALCFMLNGFFIVWNEFPTIIESAIWLPLMFLLIEKIVRQGEWKYFLALAAVLSMSILAGMFQIALYNIYASGLYLLWRGIGERKRLTRKKLALLLSCFCASVLVALALSAVQVLPFYELISRTHRQKVDLQKEFFPTVCPPEFMVQYLMPEFFGSHTEGDFWFLGMAQHMNEDLKNNEAWSSNLAELNGYTGVIVFIFALMALVGKKRKLSWFFVLLILISRLPVFSKIGLSLYYYVIPGFQTSWAGRLSFLYMFALICLAAFGLDKTLSSAQEEDFEKGDRWLLRTCWYLIAFSLLFLLVAAYFRNFDTDYLSSTFANGTGLPERFYGYYIAILAAGYFWQHTLRTIITFIGIIAAFSITFFLFKKRKILPQHLAYVVILLALTELFYFQHRFHPVQKKDLFSKTESIRYLQKNLGSARIARYGNSGVLPFNTSLFYGLRDSQGYLALVVGRASSFLKALDENSVIHERWATSFMNPQALEKQMFDLLNVKYVLTDTKTTLKKGRFRLMLEDGIRIYEYEGAIPRAFFVRNYKVLQSGDEVLKTLSGSAVDLRKTVLLEEVPHEALPPSTSISAAVARIVSDNPNAVEIEVNTPEDGFLVLNDTFYPGWKAYVDGAEQKIYRANYMFRAVFVSAGKHEIAFRYRPASLFIGATISAITLAALLLALLVSRLHRHS
jgi:hypothetical protein